MNNKGMAISSILYIILVLFVALLYGVLGLITSGQRAFNKAKDQVEESLNNFSEIIKAPTINYTVTDNIAKIYFADDKFVSYYVISNIDEEPTNWIDIQPVSKYELEYEIDLGNTYYVFARDDEGNVTKISFNT